MNIEKIQNVYFIGIGGIGMSALARYFKSLGKNIAGYDLTPTGLTAGLISEGIDIHFSDDVGLIPKKFLEKKNKTLIVYTPAIPTNHREYLYFKLHGYLVHKRSEVLGLITKNRKTIAVAGTHGKTTVSTMIAYLMDQSDIKCTAFLGGISNNFESNLLISTRNDYVVVEADEFDRSFLALYPYYAVITSVDADHLDIYKTWGELKKSFSQFVQQIKPEGKLIIKRGLDITPRHNVDVLTYALNQEADFYAKKISLNNGLYTIDVQTPGGEIRNLDIGVQGLVNVENAIAAIAVSYLLGIDTDIIRDSLKSFKGVKRRFDVQINSGNIVYIDDYAHHPKELEAFINSVRDIYPGKKITGIFQPHLYSRTSDFADEFAKSLDLLDEVILLDIYPAREIPVEGVTSGIIFDKLNNNEKILCPKADLPAVLNNRKIEVLLTMGAGDIDKLVKPIRLQLLNTK